jgi:hypothetical protein
MQVYIKEKCEMGLKEFFNHNMLNNEYFVKKKPFLVLDLIFTTTDYLERNLFNHKDV